MIQAMTWALVFTSGAGMSAAGRSPAMRWTNFRVSRSSSPVEAGRVAGDPPFRAAVGDVHDGGLPGHERGERADVVGVDVGWYRRPPFIGPRRCCAGRGSR